MRSPRWSITAGFYFPGKGRRAPDPTLYLPAPEPSAASQPPLCGTPAIACVIEQSSSRVPVPRNVQPERNERAIGHATQHLSVEPLWEAVSLAKWLGPGAVRWLIVGGESKQGKAAVHEFRLEWARALRAECLERGVPFFLKQLGTHVTEAGMRLKLSDSHGGNWEEFPEDLRVRELLR